MTTRRATFRPERQASLVLAGLSAIAFVLVGGIWIALRSDRWGEVPQGFVDACLLISRSIAEASWSWMTHHPDVALALTFLAISMVWALGRLGAALLRGWRLGAKLSAYEGGRFASLDQALRLAPEVDPARIGVIPSLRPEAFTSGFVRPKICLSEGLLQTMREPELQAVLRHEHAHARALDPLRLAAVRFLSDFLWFLPVTRPLAEAFSSMAEIRADEAAVEAGGDALELASAIARTAREVAAAPRLAPALGGLALVEERVLRLLGQGPPPPTWIGWRGTLVSAFVVAALLGLLVSPPSGMAAAGVQDRMAAMRSMMGRMMADCDRQMADDPNHSTHLSARPMDLNGCGDSAIRNGSGV